jgi:pimeloyl-ACP methyl ester carboxylesterase
MQTRVQDRQHDYVAPRPRYPWQSWFSFIVARLVFPPILLWDASKFIINKLTGYQIGQQVLISQGIDFSAWHETAKQDIHELQQAKIAVTNFTVQTHDFHKMDTLALNTGHAGDPYIIHLVGNGMSYEQITNEMGHDALDNHCNVVGFNFRGVGKYRHQDYVSSYKDLCNDGIAQVQRVLELGVNPEKIYLKGHSLGAGVATLVAKHFHDLGIQINLFNGNSFSSITNVIIGHLIRTNQQSGHVETPASKLLGWVIKPFLKLALLITDWEIDAATAYKALPDTHKEYVVVRSDKARRNHYGTELKDDATITYYGSLHSALKSERRKQKQQIDQALENLRNPRQILVADEFESACLTLERTRDLLKVRKVQHPEVHRNAHDAPLHLLRCRHDDYSAKEFFGRFFRRSQAHHLQYLANVNVAKTRINL